MAPRCRPRASARGGGRAGLVRGSGGGAVAPLAAGRRSGRGPAGGTSGCRGHEGARRSSVSCWGERAATPAYLSPAFRPAPAALPRGGSRGKRFPCRRCLGSFRDRRPGSLGAPDRDLRGAACPARGAALASGSEASDCSFGQTTVSEVGRLQGARVVFVLPWAALGGAERSALALARHLRDAEGAEVEVVALTAEEGRAAEVAGSLGLPWLALPVHWAPSRRRKVAELARLVTFLRERKPDALMPYCNLANVLCGLCWRLTGARTCVWHQQDVSPSRRLGPALQHLAARQTHLLVSNSQHGADFLVRELGAPGQRVRVVREGVS
ncbi:MAG: hypothetical protein C4307_05460, partial [Chloroflexota bacterium]